MVELEAGEAETLGLLAHVDGLFRGKHPTWHWRAFAPASDAFRIFGMAAPVSLEVARL